MKKNLLLAVMFTICIIAAGQTYNYSYTVNNSKYGIQAIFSVPSWGNETDLEIRIINQGSNNIDLQLAELWYNAPSQPTFINITSLGGCSWPDRIGSHLIPDVPLSIIQDTLVFPAGAWAVTKLAPGQVFGYKENLGSNVATSDYQTIASSIRLYAAGWVQPQLFVPVTFFLTGSDGNKATVYIKNTAVNYTTSQSIANNTTLMLRNNSPFNIWADNFAANGFLYNSVYTTQNPLGISTPNNTTATLSFTKSAIASADVPVNISGLPAGATTNVTLTSQPGNTVPYTTTVTLPNGNSIIRQVPLGVYTVSATKYINESTNILATPSYNNIYTVTNSSPALGITFSSCNITSLNVPGWPKYVAMGTVTQPDPSMDAGLEKAPVSAIFKYSGDDGAGDRGKLYADYPYLLATTTKTLDQARRVEAYYRTAYNLPGFTVIPVMVHYTSNASGGGTVGGAPDYLDSSNLRIHYRNLIREVKEMLRYKDAQHPNPGAFVLSPDLLGALQQDFSSQQTFPPYNYNNPTNFNANVFKSKIFVNKQLALAYKEEGLSTSGLPVFVDSLKGYFQSVNYLIHDIGQESILFGWQENLWAIGSANWIHTSTTSADAGQQVVDFLHTYTSAFEGPYKPSFFVIDRYERDCYGPGTSTSYAYNATKWVKTVDYGGYMAKSFGLPLMLWQFPGGHLVHKDSAVVQYDLISHSSACGTFFMGEKSIGTNLDNINSTQQNISIPPGNYNGASTVRQLLNQDNGYDWSQRQVDNAIKNNDVFAILWGGGSTTGSYNIGTNGYDDGWLAGKLREYYRPDGRAYKTGGALASGYTSDMAIVTGPVTISNGCSIIASVTPSGTNPVSGTLTAKHWLESTVPVYGANSRPYVQRHFELNPAVNAATATGTITLYFSQAEFDAYNNNPKVVNGTYPKLPSGPNDASNIKNIKISRVKGVSSDGSGLRESYNGKTNLLSTKAIWNSSNSWWEVQFKVNGFGGLFLHTGTTPLTLQAINLTAGLSADNKAALTWNFINDTNEQPEINNNSFTIERSADENKWQAIGKVYSSNYNIKWIDAAPLPGFNYYRVVKENFALSDERIFSNEQRVEIAAAKSSANIFPNPAKDMITVITNSAVQSMRLSTATGEFIPLAIQPGETTYHINIANLKAGTYFIEIIYVDGFTERKKIIRE